MPWFFNRALRRRWHFRFAEITLQKPEFSGNACVGFAFSVLCLVFPRASHAQTALPTLPQSSLKRCGQVANPSPIDATVSALAVLQKTVSAMDPHGTYASSRKFSIAGTIVDTDITKNTLLQTGTFSFQDDYTVAHGNYVHQFVINGSSHTVAKTNGTITDIPQLANAPAESGQLAFIPKSYIFPLAVLQDELSSQSLTATFVRDGPSILSDRVLVGLQHIQTVNHAGFGQVEDWYIDPKTMLPTAVGYQLPVVGKASACVQAFTRYDGYENLSGTVVATQVFSHRGSGTMRQMTIQTLGFVAKQ